ncbi:MAG: stress responsive protein [Paenibacillus sp. RIFOXYA1_FULL_44_5]|nr:MAG: stress responsive protein [Paenibacillus sp. RIFOXYA1_FULL_44_5]
MITHIVCFKLQDRSESSIAETVQVLANMKGKIPQLIEIEVGTDVLHLDRSYDIALVTRFHSMDDLQDYQVHPLHQEVIKHMKRVVESSVSVDYES